MHVKCNFDPESPQIYGLRDRCSIKSQKFDIQICFWNRLFDQFSTKWIIPANAMTGVRGNSVTLRCPIDPSDDNMLWRSKDWFKVGIRESIARLITRNSSIRHIVTSSEDMLISYPDGDLTIQNLRHEDAGVYICRFTGSRHKKIRLLVTGRLIFFYLYYNRTFWQMYAIVVTYRYQWLPNISIIFSVDP